jgi:hypothetical protein
MEYMVSAGFRPQDQAEILARIQEEGARLQTLREQGTVEVVYLSADRSHVWIVMQGSHRTRCKRPWNPSRSIPIWR